MSAALALWFAISVTCDVAGQLCFKVGIDRIEDASGLALVGAVLRQPWVMAGVGVYIVEIFVWLRILAEAPLSIAFPVASLNFLGVALASALVLKEKVAPRQWLGAGLITFGVAIVAQTA